MTDCTRVLLRDVPPMLGDIVRNVVATQPDMMLLQEESRDVVLASWRCPDPDVVVLSADDIQRATTVAETFRRWPRARVLVIEISGRQTMLYELQPRATALGALSPDQLAESIRGRGAR